MLAGLTDKRCECCGRIENDEVAELLLCEALHDYALEMERLMIEREEKRQQDAAAFAEADRISREQQAALQRQMDGAR